MFRDRPGADIILDDSYLLQVVPYIHQNPVQAGLVSDPAEYEWHTDALYRGKRWKHGPLDSWRFPPHFEDESRDERYRERMGEETSRPEGGEGYVGNEEEWDRLEKRKDERQDRYRERRGRLTLWEIAEELAAENGVLVEELVEPGRSQPAARIRQQVMVEMYQSGYGPKEIGDFFGRSKGTVIHAVNKDRRD